TAMTQQSTKISAGEAFLQILKAHNIEYIFSSPGSEWLAVWEALAKLRAREEPTPYYINARHEELAVGLASGYHKTTGKLPAVLVHSTVGTMHATMAMRAALHEHVPMVVAAGESTSFGEDPSLDPGAQWQRFLTDIGGPALTAERVVKWTERVTTLANLPGLVHHACQVALTPPMGPVFLSFPMELLLEEMPEESVRAHSFPGATFQPDSELLGRVAQMLVEAKSPLIITEHAGRDPENVANVVELAESLAIPVVESQSPMYLNVPHDHPLHLGYDPRPYLADADVVLLLGVNAPWHPPAQGPG